MKLLICLLVAVAAFTIANRLLALIGPDDAMQPEEPADPLAAYVLPSFQATRGEIVVTDPPPRIDTEALADARTLEDIEGATEIPLTNDG